MILLWESWPFRFRRGLTQKLRLFSPRAWSLAWVDLGGASTSKRLSCLESRPREKVWDSFSSIVWTWPWLWRSHPRESECYQAWNASLCYAQVKSRLSLPSCARHTPRPWPSQCEWGAPAGSSLRQTHLLGWSWSEKSCLLRSWSTFHSLRTCGC